MTSRSRKKRPAKRFTAISIAKLRPEAERYEVSDLGAHGLFVVVHPSAKRSFVVRYRHAGVPKKLTLQAGISLAAARAAAADAMHEVSKGHDPSEAAKAKKTKAAAAAVNTLQFVCEEYFKREHGKLRTAASREATLRRLVFPTLGSRQIGTIKRSEIARLLDKIEDSAGARTADLVLAYLRRIMRWHATRDDEFRSPIISGMGRYSVAEHARSRVLSDAEIKTLWQAAEANGYYGRFLKFLFLTTSRRGEATGLRWDEIQDGVWILPATRNKTKTELARPLSKAALAIVDAQPRLGDYVFTFDGRRPVSHAKCKKDIQKHAKIADWRLHDVRRTARTLLSRAGIIPDVAERCLGHAIPGIRATYDRHDFLPEKAHAFEALAAQVETIVHPPAGDVVPMRRRKR
jgi:integrase